jgi:hypothetical protein
MPAGYDPTKPGLDEARLVAIKALLISKLSVLNTAIARDSAVPLGTITSSMVEIGDTETTWNIGDGPLRIRITAGGENDGLDYEAEMTMGLDKNTGWKYTYTTNLYVYIHPDAMANLDSIVLAQAREFAKARLSDWITLGVFNYWDSVANTGGVVLNLASNVMTPPPGVDALLDSMIKRVYKGNVAKSYGGAVLFPTLHLVHVACVE